MKLTEVVYYVPYGYPRWSGCQRHYRRTRLKRDCHAFASRLRFIKDNIKNHDRYYGKSRPNPFKYNVRIRNNFKGASRYNRWY